MLAPGIAVGLVSAPDPLTGQIYEVVRITGEARMSLPKDSGGMPFQGAALT